MSPEPSIGTRGFATLRRALAVELAEDVDRARDDKTDRHQ
jgi:hypothetical protein